MMQETAQQYIQRILGHVEGQDAIKVQRTTAAKLKKLTHGLTPKEMKWKPEPGKWSIAEIMAHLSDVEIVVGWRMRSIAGASGITTQPFDQDVWASVFQYNNRDVKRSLEIFRVLRENNLAMLKALPRETWDNYGMHLERGKETLAQVVRLLAGHDNNHVSQIENIVAQLKSARRKSPGKKTAGKKTKRR
ncbi:MAG TPA: DinB family protein [Candidatus Sulfotelmatobacter sp.]|nr:DinB family protein [Candidatus Sulfotelmatobacter sp.]